MPHFLPRASFHSVEADGVQIFYREAGPADAPILLLLHGFPTSSHMFRELIPRLAEKYYVIAPDLPGFGFTQVPPERSYTYTFGSLAVTLEAFVNALHLSKYALYVFDYGAPVGFRLAVAHPERVAAIISQNGNAYEDGMDDSWNDIRHYWAHPNPGNRAAIRPPLDLGAIYAQYTANVPHPETIAPESYTLDAALIERPGFPEIQFDLFLDYVSNVALYPTFHQYFRDSKPPLLAIWGKNDPIFIPSGAEAFRRDNPHAVVELLDAGHFALETHVDEIASSIHTFLAPLVLEKGTF